MKLVIIIMTEQLARQDEKVVTEGRIITARDRPTREKEQRTLQRGAFSVDSGGDYLVGHGNNFLGSAGNLIRVCWVSTFIFKDI